MDDEQVRIDKITEALQGANTGSDDDDDDEGEVREETSATPASVDRVKGTVTSPSPSPAVPAVATPVKENKFTKKKPSARKVQPLFGRDAGQQQGHVGHQNVGGQQIVANNASGGGRGAGGGSNSSKYTVEGSNIGSTAREPVWTSEDLQEIAKLKSMRLNTTLMSETRRSARDPAGKYVGVTHEGAVSAKPSAWLGNIGWNEFRIGMGRAKPDEKTGKGKVYSDIVMKGNDWVLNQWTMNDVVVEGVPEHILEKAPRMIGGRPERRIGHDFLRIGLSAKKVAPVLETIRAGMPNVMSSMSVTNGFYWVNASWGVTGNPGKFVYKDANGIMQSTYKAYEAMKMIMGSSSMGVATVAISVGNNTKMQDGKLVPIAGEEEFSIKIHNMLHLAKVPYSSPPQSAANGFDVSQDIYDTAESLTMPSGMTGMFSQTAGAFGESNMNPFANVNSGVGYGTIGNKDPEKMHLL